MAGVGQMSDACRKPGPVVLSLADFFVARPAFQGVCAVLSADNTNQINHLTGARAMAATNNLQARLPFTFTVKCEVCPNEFEVERGKGRPLKFCSDTCRDAQSRAQKNAWQKRQAALRTTPGGT